MMADRRGEPLGRPEECQGGCGSRKGPRKKRLDHGPRWEALRGPLTSVESLEASRLSQERGKSKGIIDKKPTLVE